MSKFTLVTFERRNQLEYKLYWLGQRFTWAPARAWRRTPWQIGPPRSRPRRPPRRPWARGKKGRATSRRRSSFSARPPSCATKGAGGTPKEGSGERKRKASLEFAGAQSQKCVVFWPVKTKKINYYAWSCVTAAPRNTRPRMETTKPLVPS